MRSFLIALVLILTAGLAVGIVFGAVTPDVPVPDPSTPIIPGFDLDEWAVSAGALALGVFTIVAFLKAHVIPLAGRTTILASFGVSLGISLALYFMGHMEGDLIGAIMHGITAAVVASGWHDGTSSTVEKGVTEAPTTIVAGSTRPGADRVVK